MKKIVLCGLVVLLIVLTLGGCANKKSASSAEKDILAQIEEMLETSENYDESDLLEKIAGNNQIFADDEYGRKISEKIEYSIESVTVEDENGTVTIKIKSPDVYEILKEAASEVSNEDEVDLLLAIVSEKLDGDYPEINKTVTCDINFENEEWSLVYSAELFDALSGNLYSAYMGIADDIIDSVEEG